MGKDDEIRIKSGTVTKGIIGVLVLVIVVLLYFVATNHGTTSATQSAALSSANQTIANQNIRISALQANLSNLQVQSSNQQKLLTTDNNTIISLNSDLNNKSISPTNCTILDISNLTATSSQMQATVPVLLTNLATTSPLVVFASQANSGSNLISIGNGTEGGNYGNSESQQIENEYGVSPTSSSYIVQAFGDNRVLIAGSTASGTVQAGNQFIQDLYTAASQNTGSSKGISFEGMPIITSSGQPVVQIVVGSSMLPSDGVVASNIAAAIGNLAYTSTPVTAFVNPNSTKNLRCSVSR